LSSKINAVFDRNGLAVRLTLKAGEAHGTRLAFNALSCLNSVAMLPATKIKMLAASKPLSAVG
jgi:hypothetical protein